MIPILNIGEALELELKPTMIVQVVEGKIAFNLTCGNTLYVYLFTFSNFILGYAINQFHLISLNSPLEGFFKTIRVNKNTENKRQPTGRK